MFESARDRIGNVWTSINPSPAVWRGAVAGIFIAALIAFAYTGWYARTGLGKPLDLLILSAGGAAALFTVGALVALGLTVLRLLPRLRTGLVLASFIALVAVWQLSIGESVWLAAGLVLIEALLGGSLTALRKAGFRESTAAARSVVIGSLVLGIVGNASFIVWLFWPGSETGLVKVEETAASKPLPLEATDPGTSGPFSVNTLTYGSGTDRRRPEFGAEVDLSTIPVDATPFVEMGDLKARHRAWYWGFGADEFPRNGRVWYPEAEGTYPLVLIVHGNDNMTDPADTGYAYLGELLASRGFIAVSVDETFFGVYFPTGGLSDENDARGWMLLKHLELWREWNETPRHVFQGKVDLNNVALVGHSRGGEAVAIAAAFNQLAYYPDDATVAFDFGFGIRGIVAIAPSDGQYEPTDQPLPLKNVNYLLLHGSHDGDVSSFVGLRQYQRLAFDQDGPWFKTLLYAYRANHGQFNTSWGRVDAGMPTGLLLNTKALLPEEDQRRIAETWITAFIEATLHDRLEYLPMFRDPRRAASWLPKTLYISQFHDVAFRTLCDHEEDIDVTSTTLPGGRIEASGFEKWRQADLKLRSGGSQQNQAVYLKWTDGGEASYSIALPENVPADWRMTSQSRLVFNLCDAREDPSANAESIDLTIELTDRGGRSAELPLSHFGRVLPPLRVRFTKFPPREKKRYQHATEPVLQTYELPLAEFAAIGDFDPAQLATITFRFDHPAAGSVYLDEIGFSQPRSQ